MNDKGGRAGGTLPGGEGGVLSQVCAAPTGLCQMFLAF